MTSHDHFNNMSVYIKDFFGLLYPDGIKNETNFVKVSRFFTDAYLQRAFCLHKTVVKITIFLLLNSMTAVDVNPLTMVKVSDFV